MFDYHERPPTPPLRLNAAETDAEPAWIPAPEPPRTSPSWSLWQSRREALARERGMLLEMVRDIQPRISAHAFLLVSEALHLAEHVAAGELRAQQVYVVDAGAEHLPALAGVWRLLHSHLSEIDGCKDACQLAWYM